MQVWAGPLSDSAYVVVLFNRSPTASPITAQWSDVGLNPDDMYLVRDLWAHQDAGIATGSYTATVQSHGVVMVKLTLA